MNRFEARLNHDIKERMLARQYPSYVGLYDVAVNVERTIKERNNYFNEQRGIKRKDDQQGASTLKSRTKGLPGTTIPTTMYVEANTPTLGLG